MPKYLRLTLIFLLFVAFIFFSKQALDHFLADYYHSKAKALLHEGDLINANKLTDLAIRLNTREPTYHRTQATIYISAEIISGTSEESKNTLRENAFLELETARALQPENLVNLKNLVPIYYFLALVDPAKPESSSIAEEYKTIAKDFYKNVQGSSPTDASVFLITGKYYRLLKDYPNAEISLERALALKPDLLEAKNELSLFNNDLK